MSKEFANSLKKQLNESGKSMKQLADYLGVSPSSVTLWCCGKAEPRMSKVDKMCEYFGVNRSTMLGLSEEQPIVSDERSAALILAYATKIAKLSKEQQDIIISIINQFEGK